MRRRDVLQSALAAAALPLAASRKAQMRSLEDHPTPANVAELVSLGDYEQLARTRLSLAADAYLGSGVADERTVRANQEAFAQIRLRTRVLTDVSTIDTRLTLLGRERAFPIVLAPTAYNRLFHPDGELAVARGARAAEATYTVSSFSTTTIEDIRAETTGSLWFQLYVLRDRGLTREIIQRAEGAGCEALCLTIDHPVAGARNRERRSGFELPVGLRRVHLDKLGATAGQLGRAAPGRGTSTARCSTPRLHGKTLNS